MLDVLLRFEWHSLVAAHCSDVSGMRRDAMKIFSIEPWLSIFESRVSIRFYSTILPLHSIYYLCSLLLSRRLSILLVSPLVLVMYSCDVFGAATLLMKSSCSLLSGDVSVASQDISLRCLSLLIPFRFFIYWVGGSLQTFYWLRLFRKYWTRLSRCIKIFFSKKSCALDIKPQV